MAIGRLITGRTTVVTAGAPVALSSARHVVRDLQLQSDSGNGVFTLMYANSIPIPWVNTSTGATRPPTVIPGPVDLRRVFVDSSQDGKTAIWMATEAE